MCFVLLLRYQKLNNKQRLFVFDKQALAADITYQPDPAHSYKIFTKLGAAAARLPQDLKKKITKMGAFLFYKIIFRWI